MVDFILLLLQLQGHGFLSRQGAQPGPASEEEHGYNCCLVSDADEAGNDAPGGGWTENVTVAEGSCLGSAALAMVRNFTPILELLRRTVTGLLGRISRLPMLRRTHEHDRLRRLSRLRVLVHHHRRSPAGTRISTMRLRGRCRVCVTGIR